MNVWIVRISVFIVMLLFGLLSANTVAGDTQKASESWTWTIGAFTTQLNLNFYESNTSNRYYLHIVPLIEQTGDKRNTFIMTRVKPGSITLSVPEEKAHFKKEWELYYDIPGSTYSVTEQNLGGTRYKPRTEEEEKNSELQKKSAEAVLGEVPVVGDLYTVYELYDLYKKPESPKYVMSSLYPSVYYVLGKDPESSVNNHGYPDAIFTDDSVYDLFVLPWKQLGERINIKEIMRLVESREVGKDGIKYWFNVERETTEKIPLYIRAVIPFQESRRPYGLLEWDTYYAEVEWKVELPGTEQAQEDEEVIQPSGSWEGEYFNNYKLSGEPVLERDDGSEFIDFDWGYDSPDPKVNSDFSARWTRTVYFKEGTYRFSIGADDGLRLIIDGVVRKEVWRHSALRMYTVDVPFSEGNHTIVFEYFDDASHAIAKLSWEKIK